MRVRELLAEAWASARAQRVPTILVAALVAAMCATTLLTVGRAAAAQGDIAARLDDAGSRHLVVTDVHQRGFLTAPVVDQVAGLSSVERAVGLASAVDTTNVAVGIGGTRVPTWLVVGDLHAVVRLTAGRWPNPGEALVSAAGQAALGLDAPVGAVTTTTGVTTSYPVVGAFASRSPYQDLEAGVVVAAPDGAGARRLDVVATTAAQADATQTAVLALLARSDPADLQVESPATLAQIQADVLGDLARYHRSLAALVLLAGALLVAVVALADVLVHRTEIGRRRALGAPRWALMGILVGRSLVAALAGATVGTLAAVAVVLRSGQRPDIAFTLATAVLAVLAASVATAVPALVAARQDPVRVLRTP